MILRYLSSQPATQPQLAKALGVSTREVQEMILAARLGGAPICSGDEGIWLSEDAAEVAEMAARLRRRAINQLLTSRALRQTAKRMASPAEVPVEEPSLWAAL
jgi:Mn-dependent DtxR family transcriptional regulator